MSTQGGLPAGWTARWDQSLGRRVFEHESGHTQMEPPSYTQGVNGSMQSGDPARAFSPSAAAGGGGVVGDQAQAQAQQQQQPQSAAARPGRRQYAANQTAAYGYDRASAGAGAGAGGGGSGQYGGYQDPASQQQGQYGQPQQQQFFSPAFGDPNNQLQGGGGAPALQAPYYAQQQQQGVQQQGVIGPGAPVHGRQYSQQMGYGGQQGQGPQQPGVAGLTNQFGQMGFGGQQRSYPVQTTNLIGLPLDPRGLDSPPPEIRLPPNASFSSSPKINAHYSWQRSTLNAMPANHSILSKSKLPLALVITPYRSVKPEDEAEHAVPVVSDTVIARCRRCRTYINPYVTFLENGNRWKCCMCNLSNEIPQLFDWDQANNQPADRWQRAELNHSVVDFVAPTEYMVRPPQALAYVFLIDVSYAAVNCGMVATAARTILESLDRIPNEDNRTKISLIAVDSNLHFFFMPPGATEPSMLVVGDLDDIFLPKPADLLVSLSEARTCLESLLSRLSDMFKDNHNVGNAMSSALQSAYKLISGKGGKIVVLSASLPSLGPGALKNREDPKVFGTAKESALLQTATSFYKLFAIDCSKAQISVDMWLFASAYTDVATLSCLPRYTGGQTYFYPAFTAARSEDALKFAHEFGEVLSHPIALEAVMRVRTSRGLKLSAFHGNFFVRSTDLLALPAVPIDQSYCIELQIEDPLTQPFVVLQTAVLNTSSNGERRIRVITTALPVTSSISELYGSADQFAIATLLANKAVERSMHSKLEDARDAVTNKVVDILGTYKATMTSSASGPSPQLVVSDNLKYLPLLMLGLLKHVGLRQSTTIPSDLRAYAQALLTTLPTQLILPYLHPTLYALHNMPKECGVVGDDGVLLPPALNLTSERLDRHGLHLIEDGQNMFLWLGRAAVPALVNDAFGRNSYEEVQIGKTTLPTLENSFSQRITAIIGRVREQRRSPYYPHLYVVKEDGDPALRMWALSFLIEDRTDGLPSYREWLESLRNKVNSGSFS